MSIGLGTAYERIGELKPVWVGDEAYTISPYERLVLGSTTLTANRTWTLPDAHECPGHLVSVYAPASVATNTLTVASPEETAQFSAAITKDGGYVVAISNGYRWHTVDSDLAP